MPVIDVGGDPYWRQATSKLGQIWSGGNEGQRVLTAERALQERQQTDMGAASMKAWDNLGSFYRTNPNASGPELGRAITDAVTGSYGKASPDAVSSLARAFTANTFGAPDSRTTNAVVGAGGSYGSTYAGERMSQDAAMARQRASEAAATDRVRLQADLTPVTVLDPAADYGRGALKLVPRPQALDPSMGYRAPATTAQIGGLIAAQDLPNLSPEQRATLGDYAPKAERVLPTKNYIANGKVFQTNDALLAKGVDVYGQPLPPGGYTGNVQGGAGDVLPKPVQTDVARSNRALDAFDATVASVEGLVRQNPNSVGIPGVLKSGAQDVNIVAQSLASSLGFKSAPEAVAQMQAALTQNGADPEVIRSFDPTPDAITSAYQILLFQTANILAPGDKISNDDVKRAAAVVGDPRDIFSNQQKLLAKLEQIKSFSTTIRNVNRGTPNATPAPPTAGGLPPQAAAPQVVDVGKTLNDARRAIQLQPQRRQEFIQRLIGAGITPPGDL